MVSLVCFLLGNYLASGFYITQRKHTTDRTRRKLEIKNGFSSFAFLKYSYTIS